ncbi:MAG: hypothetical protein OEZ01_11465 [Candidatus Heimdallarchaeota archaeon]|nr:hypothetical protein [Candidatus Heimdallarchaeota archaeon]MDH5646620.1 hypothetical protein [Candidatus Heimdallarchaeota archaeon]
MNKYEFTEEENKVFKGLSLRLTLIALFLIMCGLLTIVTGLIYFKIGVGSLGTVLFLEGLVLFPLAFLLYRPADNYTRIVDRTGGDIDELMTAIKETNFSFKYVYIFVALIFIFEFIRIFT